MLRIWKSGRSSPTARKKTRPRILSCEKLEEKLVMYNLSGQAWDNTDVSYSLAPDGTTWNTAYGTGQSVLFHAADELVATDHWQLLIARAFQSWANQTNLNFHRVSDNGAPAGVESRQYGDIRIGAVNYGSPSGWAYHPGPGIGGDITLRATAGIFKSYYTDDLFRQLVTHEAGHALGLGHSDVPYNTMGLGGSLDGPQADDIAGIQAIYGIRQDDLYDQAGRNDSFSSASSVQFEDSSLGFRADLTSHADVDHYQVAIPSGAESLTVSVDARSLSLLAPKIEVYDAQQNLVATASGDYGTVATVSIRGLNAGQTYTIVADGATSDEFGMGAYRLAAQLTGNVNTASTPPSVEVLPVPPIEEENNQDAADQPTDDEVVTVTPTPTPTPTTPVHNTSPPVQPPAVRSPLTLGGLRRLLTAGAIETTNSADNQVDPTVEFTPTPTTSESTPTVESTPEVSPTPPVVQSPVQETSEKNQTTDPVESSTEPATPTSVTPSVDDDPIANQVDQSASTGPETPATTETPAPIPSPTIPVRSQLTLGGLRRLLLASTVQTQSETLTMNEPAALLLEPKPASIEPQLATFAAFAEESDTRKESAPRILPFSNAIAKPTDRLDESRKVDVLATIPFAPIRASKPAVSSSTETPDPTTDESEPRSENKQDVASAEAFSISLASSRESSRADVMQGTNTGSFSSWRRRWLRSAKADLSSHRLKVATDVDPQARAEFGTGLDKQSVDHLLSSFGIDQDRMQNAA